MRPATPGLHHRLSRTRHRTHTLGLALSLTLFAPTVWGQTPTTHYEYDANGNRTKISAPLGRTSVMRYDALNRLVSVTDPGNGVTQLAYDGQSRLTQVTDPRNLITRYLMDGLGNQNQLQSPDTGTTLRSYDAAGNELTRTDAKGQVTATAYDALNRPTLITYHDGSQVRFIWDQGGGAYTIGRLARIEELTAGAITSTLQYSYDAQGRIVSETRNIDGLSHTVAYVWLGGKLAGMSFPSGRQLSYTRNVAGQISAVNLIDTGAQAGQSKVLASAISYHPFGGLKSWTDGAGQTHARAQDSDGRPSAYNLAGVPWLISYDGAGRISAQMDGGNAQNSGTYGYDPLDRLNSAALPTTAYGYGYDPTGNRTTQTIGASTRTYVTDPASNKLQSVSSTPPKIYSTDPNGSITGDGQNQFGYDARGRLSQTITAAGTTQYRINALGQRIRKTTTGSSGRTDTDYHYDQAGHLIAESDATGKVTREYFWLDDTPLAVMQ